MKPMKFGGDWRVANSKELDYQMRGSEKVEYKLHEFVLCE